MFASYDAEKISFAYYLATNSILLYCEAAYRISLKLNREDMEEAFSVTRKEIFNLIGEHEELTASYQPKK